MTNNLHPACAHLRALREAAGMSVVAAARRVGIAAATLTSYELGTRQPSLHRVDSILATYGHRLTVEPIPDVPEEPVPVRARIDNAIGQLRQIADQISDGAR